MSLTLHFHPLASFCWKALIALYENDTPFAPNMVDLGNAAERAALLKLWPIGKFPVLRDDMSAGTWAMGEAFGLADCAAMPPLFYGNMVEPFGDAHKNVTAYFERLKARPSVARVLKEAEPYFNMVPK
jgi:glutathione S-transferase